MLKFLNIFLPRVMPVKPPRERKKPQTRKFEFWLAQNGRCVRHAREAPTRSEARALLKRDLKLRRLPPGATVRVKLPPRRERRRA